MQTHLSIYNTAFWPIGYDLKRNSKIRFAKMQLQGDLGLEIPRLTSNFDPTFNFAGATQSELFNRRSFIAGYIQHAYNRRTQSSEINYELEQH